MSTRNYGQSCSVARFLDQLGARWSLLLVRDLLVGPRRFKELLANAPAMGPNLLTTRLRELGELGIVEKDGQHYRLTEAGHALEPVILAMSRWSLQHLSMDPTNPGESRPDLLVVAFRAVFNPAAASDVNESYEFRIDDITFFARIKDRVLTTGLGAAEEPAFVFKTTSETFDRIAAGQLDISDAETSGLLNISGSRRALQRFLKAFAA